MQQSRHIRSRYKVCDDINLCIEQLSHDSKLAVAVSRLHINAYHLAEQMDFYCFAKESSVYSFPVSIITLHSFHLLPKMNLMISNLLEFGLILKWAREEYIGTLYRKILERRYYAKNFGLPNSNDRIIILTVSHISGAIVILCIGYGAALIIFIVEMIVGRKMQYFTDRKQRNIPYKIWSLVEKSISDDCLLKKNQNTKLRF